MGCLPLIAAALLTVAPAPAASSGSMHALAATPQFRHYGVDQGLPSSNVYVVAQDHQGLLWFGTIAGVARFDGTHFTVYRHVPGDPTSLASDDASTVLVDSNGRIWVGGEGSGVNLYDPATDGFTHYMHAKDRPDSLAGDDALVMAEGRNGTLWVGCYGHGLDHMTSPGHFEHLVHDPDDPASLASNDVISLYARDGTLWIGTNRGLDMRRPDGTLVHVTFHGAGRRPPLVVSISGNDDEIRANTTAGLFVVSPDGQARLMLPGVLPRKPTLTSMRDTHGDLWVGTNTGLYLVRKGRVTYFPARPLLPGGQPGRIIWDLMVDQQGGLWVTTQNAGVAYLRPDWHAFSHYTHRPDDAGSLAPSQILALAAAGDGKLWVGGGTNVLDLLDPATGAVRHFGRSLAGPMARTVKAMAPAGHDGTWVAFAARIGLLVNGHLKLVDTPPSLRGFQPMASTADGTLYVAALDAGTYRVDRQSLAVTAVPLAFNDPLDRQTSELVMHDGRLWRSSHAGLSRLAADGTHFEPVAGVAPGQVATFAISGTELWLVRKRGLEHYRLHGGRATLIGRVDAAAGWPGMVASSILIDRRGRVWLFANAGLWRYDPAAHQFTRYGKHDGLPSSEFTTRKLVRLGDDTVFAGTVDGVVGFHPDAMGNDARAPRLTINSIMVRRAGHDVALPIADRTLHLHWDDSDLRISALGLSYVAPRRVHYRFRLAGLDADWVDTGTRGVRELASLPAGNYTLRIEAAGPSGVWASLAAPIAIQMDAPPWMRPWAWIAYAVVLLVAAYLIGLAWHRRLVQRHRMQLAEQHRRLAEQANAAKTRFLANLGHEIRTPMTGVLGMAELLLHEATDPRQRSYAQAIRHSGELLLKLVNDALDLARIEAGRFELQPAALDPRRLLDEVRQLLHGQAQAKHLELLAEVDADVPGHVEGDALRIKQIVLNLANNAIKFTPRGSVRLRAGWANRELVLHVIDTGPGISAADRERLFQRFEQAESPERSSGSGLGLAICRELVAVMGGRITLESVSGAGSHFAVYLPLPAMDTPAAAAPVAAHPVIARRVLLVEDDATVARVLQGLMQARGHHVVHAPHGLDALGALEDERFDLVLLDLDLPAVDGYQLAGMIRQRDDGRAIPIAAITARSGGDEEERAVAAGMDAFARKPLTGDQLADLIEQLCPEPLKT